MRSGDLESKNLIILKGLLFLSLAVGAAAGLFIQSFNIETLLLILICIWASCRFYYFLFYVLESYVDPSLKYRGLLDLILTILRKSSRA